MLLVGRDHPAFPISRQTPQAKIMRTVQSDLQSSILAELRWEPSVDPSRVGVAVEQGVVSLTGKVATLSQRDAAEAAVKRVRGVVAVANDLEIDLPSVHQRDDVDIAKAAVDALRWNTSVPDDQLRVTVTKGWVTLEGKVQYPHQRFAAQSAVSVLTGVRGVSNKIEVAPPVAAKDVRRQLTAALHRYAQLEADRIQIEVQGDRVTLKGPVHSWGEHDQAQNAAWKVPGVVHVDNQLSIQLS
jgi:osmotically-inducible protein OsmY